MKHGMNTEPKPKWATAVRDGFKVPMIGISDTAILENCDGCGAEHDIQEIRVMGSELLCDKCCAVRAEAVGI